MICSGFFSLNRQQQFKLPVAVFFGDAKRHLQLQHRSEKENRDTNTHTHLHKSSKKKAVHTLHQHGHSLKRKKKTPVNALPRRHLVSCLWCCSVFEGPQVAPKKKKTHIEGVTCQKKKKSSEVSVNSVRRVIHVLMFFFSFSLFTGSPTPVHAVSQPASPFLLTGRRRSSRCSLQSSRCGS